MSYPTLEQYNEAFQNPRLSLLDPELQQGQIATTGLGLPLALCGGFALTYTISNGSKKYAVRCFHKQSKDLEKRYSEIHKKIKKINSFYFIDFCFQSEGIRVRGQAFPIVKMSWATGITLGEFLDKNYSNQREIKHLAQSLRELSRFLESQNIAHGDIQPGNVMVSDGGKKIHLIDYDGMFVDELKFLGSNELGHRNFQHPNRSASSWDASLDRFSFISIDLALNALVHQPDLWKKTQSDGDSILFKANDFANPSKSSIIKELISKPQVSEDAKNFVSICLSSFSKVPSLENFVSRKNIPQIVFEIAQAKSSAENRYLSAFPVLDAKNYELCLGFVGDKVELIGKIFEVKDGVTRKRKPYVFINFSHWRGNAVKINIWSEGLLGISSKPDQSWVGKWISVIGLMEPPYVSKQYSYSHLSISFSQGNQLHFISEQEARFRLASLSDKFSSNSNRKTSNQEIVDSLRASKYSASSHFSTQSTRNPSAVNSSNQAILQKMKSSQSVPTKPAQRIPSYSSQKATVKSKKDCFIATAVYGIDAYETNTLRNWRDEFLMSTKTGRFFVFLYYKTSPYVVVFIKRFAWARKITKFMLDVFVKNFLDS